MAYATTLAAQPFPDIYPAKQTLRLTAKRTAAEGIVAFEFSSLDGAPLPPFGAGDHIMIDLGPQMSRAYSLCNDPAETHRYVIAVLKEPDGKGGSVAMHALDEGAEVAVSLPRNNFALVLGAKRHILLAGGIGITPLLSMAHALSRHKADFVLHYGVRDLSRMALRDLIQAGPFADQCMLHVDGHADYPAYDIPQILAEPNPDTHVYVCGPTPFIDHVATVAKANGWDPDQIHWEYFVAPETDDPAEKVSFEIELVPGGEIVTVGPEESVVEALEREGIFVLTSCAEGVCGTCLLELVEGEPDHRDHYLSDADKARGDCFMGCVSRAAGGRLRIKL
ncbi:vanillate O-demethylase ferredoxin subunit [Salipiger thiooxidans]|uniref:Vanillate O-demethylase ferredoxin subunit n=1 Tax=Salipiger thiooxidans TaxID=282683 RepID=A0A1G7LKY7_9RHOB|nr:PDR/VanB family oxidoreductase [Salipiger thiooxidans]SDF49609.1 vanillate O-demethylase ferredoxin subunit [Salipiger thiooxidans]